tara:strand:+ start:1966 stop:3339 length:1374 start_codon:yes stop_codon:yes gene_type:complete
MALTKVTSGVRTLATDEVGATEIAAGAVGASEVASTIDLSSKTLTIPASAVTEAMVTAHVTATDLSPVRNDIATLALHSAIADNKAAYNLSNSFIDQFEDDTGLDVQTTCDRDAAEYMTSIVAGGTGNDSNTVLLIQSDTSDGSTTFTDVSAGGTTHTVSVQNQAQHDTAQAKFGASSILFDGTDDGISVPKHTDFEFGTGNFTLDCWFRSTTTSGMQAMMYMFRDDESNSGWALSTNGSKIHTNIDGTYNDGSQDFTANSWNHIAFVRNGNTGTRYLNGVADSTTLNLTGVTVTLLSSDGPFFGNSNGEYNSREFNGHLDEIRVSKGIARWTSGFTPPTESYGTTTVNATGNFTSATQASTASVSEMGIVVLYKNNAGTATLNSGGDLIASVSANGGTNYTDVTLVAGGTFSTGINIAAVSGVSVTAGTTPKYKISFANQASGSKETQVHGVALLY